MLIVASRGCTCADSLTRRGLGEHDLLPPEAALLELGDTSAPGGGVRHLGLSWCGAGAGAGAGEQRGTLGWHRQCWVSGDTGHLPQLVGRVLGGLHKLGKLVILQCEVVTAQCQVPVHGLLHHGVRTLHAAPEAGTRSGHGASWRPGTWRTRRRRGCCRGRGRRRTPRWRGSCSSAAWGPRVAGLGRGTAAGRHRRLPFTAP